MTERDVNCYKCHYFYITWDKNFPYGCKAMGFKTKKTPSAMVRESSGFVCQSFKKKCSARKDNCP
ncbi:MAG: uracil-DNA glycosylase [bacterium]